MLGADDHAQRVVEQHLAAQPGVVVERGQEPDDEVVFELAQAGEQVGRDGASAPVRVIYVYSIGPYWCAKRTIR
jgi:hypothetical protein